MTWLGLLLVGIGVSDLLRSCLPSGAGTGAGTVAESRRDRLADAAGAAVAVVLGLLCGPPSWPGALALALVAGWVVAWGVALRHGVRAPLFVLGGGVAAAVLLAPLARPAAGPWSDWVAAAPWPWLEGLGPDRALLLLGVVLVQLSTGNQVVRLVLAATGTVAPTLAAGADPALRLQGGRLLGPMERVVIVGLGLAGELTAASVVIAAKGLLRWPELSSSREQHAIHRLTEYFLVGSFVSWTVALVGLALSG